MSGLRAPARTAIPTDDRAISTRLSSRIEPSFTRSSITFDAISTTSTGSPARTRATIAWAPSPVDVASVTALSFAADSNRGTSCRYAGAVAPADMTRTSRDGAAV